MEALREGSFLMLVKLANDWFDGFKYHKKGVVEFNGREEDLPSSAVKLTDKGLPFVSTANTPKPGFGAKPVEEQLMDLVGASDTHQIEVGPGSSGGITPAPEPSLSDKLQANSEASEKREAARAEQQKRHDADVAEAQKGTEAALKVAEKVAEDVAKSTDPIFGAQQEASKKSK